MLCQNQRTEHTIPFMIQIDLMQLYLMIRRGHSANGARPAALVDQSDPRLTIYIDIANDSLAQNLESASRAMSLTWKRAQLDITNMQFALWIKLRSTSKCITSKLNLRRKYWAHSSASSESTQKTSNGTEWRRRAVNRLSIDDDRKPTLKAKVLENQKVSESSPGEPWAGSPGGPLSTVRALPSDRPTYYSAVGCTRYG